MKTPARSCPEQNFHAATQIGIAGEVLSDTVPLVCGNWSAARNLFFNVAR